MKKKRKEIAFKKRRLLEHTLSDFGDSYHDVAQQRKAGALYGAQF